MALHLVKLCVGCDSIEDLQSWIDERLAQRRARGEPAEHTHTTRQVPKRRDDLLAQGSLYWVIRGFIQVRQRLLDIRPFTDAEGIPRCHFVLEPVLVPTVPQPCRPFQGWRYFEPRHAPADLAAASTGDELPPHLWRELAELGLL